NGRREAAARDLTIAIARTPSLPESPASFHTARLLRWSPWCKSGSALARAPLTVLQNATVSAKHPRAMWNEESRAAPASCRGRVLPWSLQPGSTPCVVLRSPAPQPVHGPAHRAPVLACRWGKLAVLGHCGLSPTPVCPLLLCRSLSC